MKEAENKMRKDNEQKNLKEKEKKMNENERKTI